MAKHFATGLIALFLVGQLSAQTQVKQKSINKKRSTVCIQGKVIDGDVNQPVRTARIQLGHSTFYTIADAFGNFSMEVDTTALSRYGSIITISTPGYDSRNVHISEFTKGLYSVTIFKHLQLQEPKSEKIEVIKVCEIQNQPAYDCLITSTKCVFIADEEPVISYTSYDEIRYFLSNSMSIPNRDNYCR